MLNLKKLTILILLLKFSFINCKVHKIVIIGGGLAAHSAAISAGNGKLNPVIIEGHEPGGQAAKAGTIKNFPGHPSINGGELTSKTQDHAEELGAKIIEAKVTKVDFKQKPFKITTDKAGTVQAHSVIIATGSQPIKLNCPGENKCWGKGVVVCATCDGHLFENKKVVIIGGGYSALRELGNMLKYTNKITVINPDKEFSAPQFLINKLNSSGVPKLTNHSVVKIIEENGQVSGIKLKNKATGKTTVLPTEGILVGLGWKPSSDIFKKHLKLNKKNQIAITNDTETSVPGIFAAGDVSSKSRHQAFMAASHGFAAAMDAEKYLKKQGLV